MTDSHFPSQSQLLQYLDFANDLAASARAIALEFFRRPTKKWTKPDHTPVTEVDLKIENCLSDRIARQYPDHGVIGEEHGVINSEAELRWCIDPIDGTKSFVYGVPTFGTLIALTFQCRPIAGVIEHPALEQRWCGAFGIHSTWQGQKCHTNSQSSLADSVVYATSVDMFSKKELRMFDKVSLSAKLRQFGVDCHAYSLLASGYIDIVMESDMKPHDMMALVPVVESAGGIMTDWSGKALTTESGPQVLAAANKNLHQQCLDKIHS